MTVSYDGAVAAIQQRMRDNIPTPPAGTTAFPPIGFQNETPPETPWPPPDGSPFVYFEVVSSGSKIYATGTPGAQIWRYVGLVHAHVFVPMNSGSTLAQQYARLIGDVFRNQRFYNDEPPSFVWTISPQTDAGSVSDQFASYWRVTCTIDFELYLQA